MADESVYRLTSVRDDGRAYTTELSGFEAESLADGWLRAIRAKPGHVIWARITVTYGDYLNVRATYDAAAS